MERDGNGDRHGLLLSIVVITVSVVVRFRSGGGSCFWYPRDLGDSWLGKQLSLLTGYNLALYSLDEVFLFGNDEARRACNS